MLEMFGLNCFPIRTNSGVTAVMKYHISGYQLIAFLLIYVFYAYFYRIQIILSILHWFLTYLYVFCDVASEISSLELSLITKVTFSMVIIKQKMQIILCPSTDECLFYRL